MCLRNEFGKSLFIQHLHNTSHDIVFTAQNIEEVLPKEFVNSFAELSAMPVFDIADRIYNIFNLSLLKDQSAYICAFYDYMNEFYPIISLE